MAYEDAFTFDGIEPIEKRFLNRAEDATYLVVKDRSLRNNEETLDRLNLTADELAPYLDDPFGVASLADDDEPGWDDEDDDGDEPDLDELTTDQKMRAAFRWVRETAIRNTVGERSVRFRVKLYGPKGVQVLATGQFVCRNDNLDLDDDGPMPDLQIPQPTFDEADQHGSVRGLKALGDYYAQWGSIVLGSVGQLQGVNNAMLARLHKQLRQSREQVDTLVASILEARVRELEVKEEAAADERAGDARHQLAREAIHQLGSAASTFLVSRGMSPEAVEVFSRIGGSSELMGALQDPTVQELMKDPDNLKGLAEMLKQAGQQAAAAGAAANATTPNTEAAAG